MTGASPWLSAFGSSLQIHHPHGIIFRRQIAAGVAFMFKSILSVGALFIGMVSIGGIVTVAAVAVGIIAT
ncbi:hypothetical protein [Methylocapsa sp. S129]|uniref:hypothetical protein n=1 Tax=Methylocapsa sp. S129 TaxID=1641869 RepID=UPI00131EB22C|nr:hypothetical protein [Methylocapsa sp. S129]